MSHVIRRFCVFLLASWCVTCWAGGPAVLIEAERAELTDATAANIGGVECAVLTKKESRIAAQFTVEKKAEFTVWVRAYFPWGGTDALVIGIDDTQFLDATARNDRSGRWDNGNFQVWHWIRAGWVTLDKGSHRVVVAAPRGGEQRLDKIALCEGNEPWRERWLTGDLALLGSRPARFTFDGARPLLMETEEFDFAEAETSRDGPNRISMRIVGDGQRIAVLFKSAKPGRVTIHLHQFFESKNMFEGYTMEEMAENGYVELDGELIWTFFEQDARRWHWRRAGIGAIDLLPGTHLLSITKQGSPIRVDKVAILPDDGSVTVREVLRPETHLLPFGLPNDVLARDARQVSDWSLFGELARATDGAFLGEETDGVTLPMRLDLPEGKGLLVLEKLQRLESCEARSVRNREQRIAVPVRGGQDIRLFVVYEDQRGEQFYAELIRSGQAEEWSSAAHVIPLDDPGTRGTHFDGTGTLAVGPLSRPLSGAAGDPEMPPITRGGLSPDGVPDYPLRVTHLVLEKTTSGKQSVFLGEPLFDSPFAVSARVTQVGSTREGKADATIQITVTSSGKAPGRVPVYFRVEALGHDFQSPLAARRALARRVVETAPGKPGILETRVSFTAPGVHRFLYSAGQGEVRTLLLGGVGPTGETADQATEFERRHGAFRIGVLKRKSGQPISRNEVHTLYGTPDGLALLVDGLDVTSREYADRMDYAQRLSVRGCDLSDEAGWPLTSVPHGVVAIDPELGRAKFSEGDEDPMSVVGRSDIGFAVPGNGAPVIRGNYAYVPPGEGNHTVIDISDRKHPKPISYLPSWYFSASLYPYGNRAYVESSRRGLILVDGYFSNPYRPGHLRSVDFDREKYGRFVHVFEKDSLAVSAGGNGLWVHDLADPYQPRLIASVANASGFAPVEKAGIAFVTSGNEVRALDLSQLRSPRLLDGSIERPRTKDDKGKESVGSLASVGEGWLAFRLGGKFVLSRWRVERQGTGRPGSLSFEAAGEIEIPKGCGHHVFSAFHKGYFYVFDGKGGPGQYGIGWGGPKSRWFVYALGTDRKEPVSTWEDPLPTAYSYVTIVGDEAFINDYNYGMWIFDLSDPAKPVKVSGAETGGEGDACWTNGRFVYLWQTFGGHLFPIDVTSPWRPERTGCYWDGAWVSYDNRFRGSYTIAGKDEIVYLPKSGRGLLAVDCSNPAAPECVGEFIDKAGKPVMTGGACIQVVDDRAYVERGLRKGVSELLIYDVSAPAKPSLVTAAEIPGSATLYKKGDILYLAGGKVLSQVSVAKDQVQVLSSLDLDSCTKDGEMIGGIAVTRGHAYLTSRDRSPYTRLYIVDVRDPKSPRFVGLVDPMPDYMDAPCSSCWGDYYQDIISDGQYLYLGNYAQIECFDASAPGTLRFVGRKPMGYQWSVGQKWGEYLYVPGLATMTVLDVPSPSQVPTGPVTVR